MIKALIFDLDDTLVNSSPLHKKAFDTVLKTYGVKLNSLPKKVEKYLLGITLLEVAKTLVKHYRLPLTPQELLHRREKIINKLLLKVKPMPGFNDLKKFLKTTALKIALASSTNIRFARLILKKLDILDCFDVIVTSENIKKSKPDPEIFLLAAKKLRLAPKYCLVVEDSENGIKAAKRAKMKVVAVKNTKFKTGQNLDEADKIINDLSGLEKTIINLN